MKGVGGLETETINLDEVKLIITVEGETLEAQGRPDQLLLQSGLETGTQIPHACQLGGCGQCRAKLISGTVNMVKNDVLDEDELEAGLILTCQSYPTSAEVILNYDAAEKF